MAGQFPLYTDENIKGPLVKALRRAGWDVLRALDVFPEGTDDDIHFEHAAKEGRVVVTNDEPMKAIAHRWLEEGRSFPGLVEWPQRLHERMRIGWFVENFEALAREDQPFDPDYPIVHIKPD